MNYCGNLLCSMIRSRNRNDVFHVIQNDEFLIRYLRWPLPTLFWMQKMCTLHKYQVHFRRDTNIAYTAVEEFLMPSLSNADNITLVCTCTEYPVESYFAKECKCYQCAIVICQDYCIFYLLFTADAFFYHYWQLSILTLKSPIKMGFYHFTGLRTRH